MRIKACGWDIEHEHGGIAAYNWSRFFVSRFLIVRLLTVIPIRYQVKVVVKGKMSDSGKSDGGSALAVFARQQCQVADYNKGFLLFHLSKHFHF